MANAVNPTNVTTPFKLPTATEAPLALIIRQLNGVASAQTLIVAAMGGVAQAETVQGTISASRLLLSAAVATTHAAQMSISRGARIHRMVSSVRSREGRLPRREGGTDLVIIKDVVAVNGGLYAHRFIIFLFGYGSADQTR